MSRNSNYILAGIGIIAFGLWYKLHSAWMRVKFRLAGIRLSNITMDDGSLTIGMNVFVQMYNPTSVSIKVGYLKAAVYLQGVYVGTIDYNYEFLIQPKSVNEIVFNTQLDATQFGETAWELLKTSQIQSWMLSIKGTADILEHNVSFSYDYPLKNIL